MSKVSIFWSLVVLAFGSLGWADAFAGHIPDPNKNNRYKAPVFDSTSPLFGQWKLHESRLANTYQHMPIFNGGSFKGCPDSLLVKDHNGGPDDKFVGPGVLLMHPQGDATEKYAYVPERTFLPKVDGGLIDTNLETTKTWSTGKSSLTLKRWIYKPVVFAGTYLFRSQVATELVRLFIKDKKLHYQVQIDDEVIIDCTFSKP